MNAGKVSGFDGAHLKKVLPNYKKKDLTSVSTEDSLYHFENKHHPLGNKWLKTLYLGMSARLKNLIPEHHITV